MKIAWTDIEQYQFFIEFLKGLRTDQIGIMTYYSLYLFRRILLVFAIVFLNDNPALLLVIYLVSSFLNIIYMRVSSTFNSDSANLLDKVCETVLYLACMVQMASL